MKQLSLEYEMMIILLFRHISLLSFQSSKIPAQSYMYLRELVGKSLNNPVIEQYLQRFPYYKLKTDAHTSELVFEHDRYAFRYSSIRVDIGFLLLVKRTILSKNFLR